MKNLKSEMPSMQSVKKQVNAIKQWESENQDGKILRKEQQYCEMVRHITGSDGAVTDGQIIKTIAREVIIDK